MPIYSFLLIYCFSFKCFEISVIYKFNPASIKSSDVVGLLFRNKRSIIREIRLITEVITVYKILLPFRIRQLCSSQRYLSHILK